MSIRMKTLGEIVLRKKRVWKKFKTASGYVNFVLYHGTAGDSSNDKSDIEQYLKDAEKEYIEKHKKEILEVAKRIVEEELLDIKINPIHDEDEIKINDPDEDDIPF